MIMSTIEPFSCGVSGVCASLRRADDGSSTRNIHYMLAKFIGIYAFGLYLITINLLEIFKQKQATFSLIVLS